MVSFLTRVQRGIVSCVEVRQAVWLALDREALRTAAGGPSPVSSPEFRGPLLAADYEPAKWSMD